MRGVDSMSKLVVYVDDEESLCELFQWHLEYAGIQVATFVDPEEALNYVNSSEIGLIVCDYRMPGMDGLAFLNGFKKDTPFCLITGDLDIDEQNASDVRLRHVWFKPIDYEHIVKIIRSILAED